MIILCNLSFTENNTFISTTHLWRRPLYLSCKYRLPLIFIYVYFRLVVSRYFYRFRVGWGFYYYFLYFLWKNVTRFFFLSSQSTIRNLGKYEYIFVVFLSETFRKFIIFQYVLETKILGSMAIFSNSLVLRCSLSFPIVPRRVIRVYLIFSLTGKSIHSVRTHFVGNSGKSPCRYDGAKSMK